MVIIMTKPIRARTMDRATVQLKLEHFGVDATQSRDDLSKEVVAIDFKDNDATRRLVMHSARRIIKQHKNEIQELAYK